MTTALSVLLFVGGGVTNSRGKQPTVYQPQHERKSDMSGHRKCTRWEYTSKYLEELHRWIGPVRACHKAKTTCSLFLSQFIQYWERTTKTSEGCLEF